jgi:hypothetical protein
VLTLGEAVVEEPEGDRDQRDDQWGETDDDNLHEVALVGVKARLVHDAVHGEEGVLRVSDLREDVKPLINKGGPDEVEAVN